MPELPIAEAAAQLRISRDTLRRRAQQGAIAGRRDARGRWWITLPDAAQPAHDAQHSAADAQQELLAEVRSERDLLRAEVARLNGRLDDAQRERGELRILLSNAQQQLAAVLAQPAQLPAPEPASRTEDPATPPVPVEMADHIPAPVRRAWWRFWR